MALPAGRYGVTKNQLLKIKKLPMNTIKLIEELTEKFDLLGSAAFKNSTSVVTDSSDLVESGAVFDIIGWGNKNIGTWINGSLSGDATVGYKLNAGGSSLIAKVTNNTDYHVSKKSGQGNRFRINGFTNEPSSVATLNAAQLYSNNFSNEYTVNSGSYNYLVFTFESSSTISQDTAEAMIEEGSSKTAYEPYHVSVEQTLRDAEVVQGMNLLDKSNRLTYNATATDTSTGINISCTNKSSANAYMNFNNLGLNKQYKVSSNVDYTSGNGAIFVMGSNDGITYSTTIESIENITADGKKVLSFNTGTYPYIRISCFATRATAQDGNISFNELMLYDAIYNNPTYEPYYTPLKDVVPNKCDNSVIAPVENQPTCQKSGGYAVGEHFIRDRAFCTCKQAIPQGGSFTLNTNYTSGDVASELEVKDLTSSITINTDAVNSSTSTVHKQGNVVSVMFNISLKNIDSGVSPNIVTGFPPSLSNSYVYLAKVDGTGGIMLYITKLGILAKLTASVAITAGTYYGTVSYLAK